MSTHIFVFGSNLAGIHGAGAAKFAREKYGAILGHGIGRTGMAYAIPTKDRNIQTLPISRIKPHIDVFIDYAESNKSQSFSLTKIGCGLAGYDWERDIRPLFPQCMPPNILILQQVLR
jgi:hypothetical protein